MPDCSITERSKYLRTPPGLEVERRAREVGDEVVERGVAAAGRARVRHPGGEEQQVTELDPVAARKARDELRERVAVRELPLLGEHRDGRRGERLRDDDRITAPRS
jgi:hypothetical protein